MRNERSKNILLGLLVIGLVTMTIAYAALSTSLNIGNSDTEVSVKGGTWNIILENGSAQPAIGDRVSWVGTPTLSNTQISGIKANFGSTANGEIKYRFRIHNYGNINAKITNVITINKTCKINNVEVSSANDTAICSGITGTLKYLGNVQKSSGGEYDEAGEGVTIAQNDLLPAGSYVDAELTITAVDNVVNRIPSGDMVVEFADIDIIYGQTTETPQDLVLTWQPTYFEFGNPTTSSTQDYTTINKNVFAGLDTSGNKGVCIKKNGITCFQANNVEFELKHAKDVFGESTCSNYSSYGYWKCTGSDYYCYVYDDGHVRCDSNTDSSYCNVYSNGNANCY